MKKTVFIFVLILGFSCKDKTAVPVHEGLKKDVGKMTVGTWRLVYGEIREKDSVQIKDLSEADFIKIINDDHFAFFNQPKAGGEGFYAGGGKYTLKGNDYTEILDYIGFDAVRGHKFPFSIEVKGDTLIQSGVEDVPEAGIKRHIVEKYIKIE